MTYPVESSGSLLFCVRYDGHSYYALANSAKDARQDFVRRYPHIKKIEIVQSDATRFAPTILLDPKVKHCTVELLPESLAGRARQIVFKEGHRPTHGESLHKCKVYYAGADGAFFPFPMRSGRTEPLIQPVANSSKSVEIDKYPCQSFICDLDWYLFDDSGYEPPAVLPWLASGFVHPRTVHFDYRLAGKQPNHQHPFYIGLDGQVCRLPWGLYLDPDGSVVRGSTRCFFSVVAGDWKRRQLDDREVADHLIERRSIEAPERFRVESFVSAAHEAVIGSAHVIYTRQFLIAFSAPPLEGQITIPARGWFWQQGAWVLSSNDLRLRVWSDEVGYLRRDDRGAEPVQGTFYHRPKVDLHLVEDGNRFEVRTGELKLHWTDPRPYGGWMIDTDASFEPPVQEPAWEHFVNSGAGIRADDLNAVVPGKFSVDRYTTAVRRGSAITPELRVWAKASSGNSVTDPNITGGERIFRDEVRGSGRIPAHSTGAAVCWGLDHDNMIALAFEKQPEPPLAVSEAEIKINKDKLANKIDRARDEIQALRTAYRPKQSGAVTFVQYYEEQLCRKLKEEYDAEIVEARDLIQEAFAEAYQMRSTDPIFLQWMKLEEEARKLQNRGKTFTLPSSADEIWIEHLRKYMSVLLPARPHLKPEIENVVLRGFKKGSSSFVAVDERYEQFAQEDIYTGERDDRSDQGNAHDRVPASACDDEYYSNDEAEDRGGADLYGDGISDAGVRKTDNPADPRELRETFRRLWQLGKLKPGDGLTYVQQLEHTPKENVRIYSDEENVNTVTQQNRRRLKEIHKVVATYDGNGTRPDLREAIEKNLSPKEALELAETGGFYAFVKFDHQPLTPYRLDVNKFIGRAIEIASFGEALGGATCPSPLAIAFFDLYRRKEEEAVRQALKSLTDHTEIAHVGYEKCKAIADVFGRAEVLFIPPSPSAVRKADVFEPAFVEDLVRRSHFYVLVDDDLEEQQR
jgi:hypothetical protein